MTRSLATTACMPDTDEREGGSWFPVATGQTRGTVLLVHGLNQSPLSWHDLVKELNSWGLQVYRLSLKGHRGLPFEDMHRVSAEIWLEEFIAGYRQAASRSDGLPLFLAAYSLGGLLAMTAQLREKRSFFTRQVLLAPALAIRFYTRLALPMTKFFPSLPSRSPSGYVANIEGTTAAAYRALFQLEQNLRAYRDLQIINVPTRVLMRPGDELLSYRATARLLNRNNLDNWQLIALPTCAGKLPGTSFQHLLVDRKAVGSVVWKRMMRGIREFLLPIGEPIVAPTQKGESFF